jgi:hypothetical protein
MINVILSVIVDFTDDAIIVCSLCLLANDGSAQEPRKGNKNGGKALVDEHKFCILEVVGSSLTTSTLKMIMTYYINPSGIVTATLTNYGKFIVQGNSILDATLKMGKLVNGHLKRFGNLGC